MSQFIAAPVFSNKIGPVTVTGTPTAGWIIIATSATTAHWADLPVAANPNPAWTFQDAGGPGTVPPVAGKFITNNADPASTTQIWFSSATIQGTDLTSVVPANFNTNSYILLSNGVSCEAIQVQGHNTGTGFWTLVCGGGGFSGKPWSGIYGLTFMPYIELQFLMNDAGITPVVDGTVTPVTSETTQKGIVTALS